MAARPERSRSDVTPTQVAEALLYVPLGLGAALVTGAPKRLRQARSDLAAARFIGEMVVTQGAKQLRSRVESAPSSSSSTSTGPVTPPPVSVPDAGGPDASPRAADAAVPSVDELAIPDYDTVPAIDVVMQLADLEPGERKAIETYERANRGRRTILGKIDQLRPS